MRLQTAGPSVAIGEGMYPCRPLMRGGNSYKESVHATHLHWVNIVLRFRNAGTVTAQATRMRSFPVPHAIRPTTDGSVLYHATPPRLRAKRRTPDLLRKKS